MSMSLLLLQRLERKLSCAFGLWKPLYLHINRYKKEKVFSWQQAACGVWARKAVLHSQKIAGFWQSTTYTKQMSAFNLCDGAPPPLPLCFWKQFYTQSHVLLACTPIHGPDSLLRAPASPISRHNTVRWGVSKEMLNRKPATTLRKHLDSARVALYGSQLKVILLYLTPGLGAAQWLSWLFKTTSFHPNSDKHAVNFQSCQLVMRLGWGVENSGNLSAAALIVKELLFVVGPRWWSMCSCGGRGLYKVNESKTRGWEAESFCPSKYKLYIPEFLRSNMSPLSKDRAARRRR